MNIPPIKGGQGRSDWSILDDSATFFTIVGLACLFALVILTFYFS